MIVPAASSAVIPEMLEHFVGLFSQAPDYGQAVPGFGNPNLLPARALHLAFGAERALGESASIGVEIATSAVSCSISFSPNCTTAITT